MLSTGHSNLILCLALLATTLISPAMGASYIKPGESREIFKLEKIPVQVDSMKELARHLVVLARRKHDGSAAEQRASGQLLALALRLDPANQNARDTNKALAAKTNILPPNEAQLSKAKARLRFYKRWLANPEAGKDANLLANYLTDATKTLHSDTANNNDLGNWSGVIPSIRKYAHHGQSDKNQPKPPTEKRNPDRTGQSDKTKNRGVSPAKSSQDFHIKEQTVSSPLALITHHKYRDPNNPTIELSRQVRHLKISRIKLELRPCPPEQQNRLTIRRVAYSNGGQATIVGGIGKVLLSILSTRHSNLPAYQSIVTVSGGEYSHTNGSMLAAPVALMLESSLANIPLRPDTHICATINDDGILTQPDHFWQLLTELRQSRQGGRLIVSPKSAKLMQQVLVYDEADFFTKWEVFSATNLDQALTLASKSSPKNLSEASQLFASIRKLAQKTDVTKLAVNNAVRNRLTNITKLAPNHVSSQILLLQGSGKRPMRLSKKALAHELLPVIEKIRNRLKNDINPEHASVSALKTYHENARDDLSKFERLVDRSNDDLYQESIKLANELRRMMLLARRASDYDERRDDNIRKLRSHYYDTYRECETLLNKTRVAAGFPPKAKKEEK